MVKKTTYDHHPVEILHGLFIGGSETHITAIALDLQTAALATVVDSDDVLPWSILNINTLALAAGITVPEGAVGALVDVEVHDSGASAAIHWMGFAPAGVLYASKTSNVYCGGGVADRPGSRLIPLLWTEAGDFAYNINASGANFDYTIKIVAWLMAGSRYTPPVIPSQELACGFRVNQ
jgi:hypothetical protein